MSIRGKKVLVLGLSKSGIAAAKFAKKHGAIVYLSEGKYVDEENMYKVSDLKSLGINVEYGSHSDEFVDNAELVVSSPGIPPHSEIIKRIVAKNIPVISELELAYRECDIPFIIITGTNGKTTTTALTEHILAKSLKVKACGNIGQPPCNIADENLDYFICEASSYQLAMSPSLKPFISVWTNFTPDHIDWHQGLENYFKAKAKVFLSPQAPKYSVLNAKDEKLLEFSKKAEGEIFKLKPSLNSDKIMLMPDDHETNFMSLHRVTTEKDDLITRYMQKSYLLDETSVFLSDVYNGLLDIEYVKDLQFIFYQVPGYVFRIKFIERETNNTGWLITSFYKAPEEKKTDFLNYLYNKTRN